MGRGRHLAWRAVGSGRVRDCAAGLILFAETDRQLSDHELLTISRRASFRDTWWYDWVVWLDRPLEYKYVIRRGAEVSEWQPGDNLIVDVPSEPAVLYIEDRWLNEVRCTLWYTCTARLPLTTQAGGPARIHCRQVLQPPSRDHCPVCHALQKRSVQTQQAASGLKTRQPSRGEEAQPVPTATDKAAKATAAAAASSPAAAAQQPTAAEPESEDAAVAAQRGNRWA
jgi:hypothetical protein